MTSVPPHLAAAYLDELWPDDQAWIDSEWPTTACTCYDAETAEWAPVPCKACTDKENHQLTSLDSARSWAVRYEQESAARGTSIAEALTYIDAAIDRCYLTADVNRTCMCGDLREIERILRAAP